MIHLYLYSVDYDSIDYDGVMNELPTIIQNRIKRKKQEKKRISSMIGYALLKQGLKQDFNINLEKIHFLASGKPVFEDQAIHFNISHSKKLVGVAISAFGKVGLDIEEFRKFEQVESSFSFFSLVEQKAILKATKPDWKLIELWSKKEALIKAIGGRMFDLAAYTDVRSESAIHENEEYFFKLHPYDFEGFVWLASSKKIDEMNVKYPDLLLKR